MNKLKINKTANNIVWVEAWIKQAHPSLDFEISAEPHNGKWKCEFDIPTVNKTVKSISNTEVNAMLNAAKKARKIINEYLVDRPELKGIVGDYWSKGWIIEEDESGSFLGLGRSDKVIRSESEKYIQRIGASRRAIETALDKVEKIFNYRGNLNIQVIDKKLLGDNPDLKELEQRVWDNYKEMYGMDDKLPKWQATCVTDSNIIFVRYQDKVIDMKEVN